MAKYNSFISSKLYPICFILLALIMLFVPFVSSYVIETDETNNASIFLSIKNPITSLTKFSENLSEESKGLMIRSLIASSIVVFLSFLFSVSGLIFYRKKVKHLLLPLTFTPYIVYTIYLVMDYKARFTGVATAYPFIAFYIAVLLTLWGAFNFVHTFKSKV
jgi:hypothetical protein